MNEVFFKDFFVESIILQTSWIFYNVNLILFYIQCFLRFSCIACNSSECGYD